MHVYGYTNVRLNYEPMELHQYKMASAFLREGRLGLKFVCFNLFGNKALL